MHAHANHNRQAMNEAALERLVSDLRVLSSVGIERAAWGWDRHAKDGLGSYHSAGLAALDAIKTQHLSNTWEQFRGRLFNLTEGRRALISWKMEHGDVGNRAELAAYGAALGLFSQGLVPHKHYVVLVQAMAEALPWLLPEQPATPYSG